MAQATISSCEILDGRYWAFDTVPYVAAAGVDSLTVPAKIYPLYEYNRNLLVKGVTAYYTRAGGNVDVLGAVYSQPAIGHYLQTKTMTTTSPNAFTWNDLDIPVFLNPSQDWLVFYIPIQTLNNDMIVLSAWGTFREAQSDQTVRFATPQTVSVEGVRFWQRR